MGERYPSLWHRAPFDRLRRTYPSYESLATLPMTAFLAGRSKPARPLPAPIKSCGRCPNSVPAWDRTERTFRNSFERSPVYSLGF
jgi:hypothetical protein